MEGIQVKFGVVVPSTNTVVEHDYNMMRPPGVTFHTGRMFIEDPSASDDQAFEQLIAQIRASLPTAVRDVMTCEPDHVIMGMSAETFWGGKAGNDAFTARVRELAGGMGVTTGADACAAACQQLGLDRIAVVTPYQEVGDTQVRGYFEDLGVEVVRLEGLRCASATAIADVRPEQLRDALLRLDGDDVDGIIQVGTNLSMVRLADEAERWLGKPVLAINAVTLWHALRSLGFSDLVHGCGRLLRESIPLVQRSG